MTQDSGKSENTSEASTSENAAAPNQANNDSEKNQFDAGYGKGADKGRREILESLGFSSLDEAKTAVTAQKDAEIKALENQKKYEELYNQQKKEFSDFKKEADSWKQSADQWTDYKKTKRESLLEKIDKDDREIYNDLSLSALEKHVAKIEKSNNGSTSRPGQTRKTESPFKILEK